MSEAPADRWTVLVVEGNDLVRRTLRRMLVQCGFETFVVESLQCASDMIDTHAGRIHLLLVDIGVVKRDGVARLEALRQREVRLAYLSWDDDSTDLARDAHGGDAAVLAKPVKPAQLREFVRDVCGGRLKR